MFQTISLLSLKASVTAHKVDTIAEFGRTVIAELLKLRVLGASLTEGLLLALKWERSS